MKSKTEVHYRPTIPLFALYPFPDRSFVPFIIHAKGFLKPIFLKGNDNSIDYKEKDQRSYER
ncbi:MAG TPA: hypothetical protein VN239_08680 [Nitrososphaera sp.]|jgi:hypothetical protein|nr:hypothetical protein [Nitrososphaera sp.]